MPMLKLPYLTALIRIDTLNAHQQMIYSNLDQLWDKTSKSSDINEEHQLGLLRLYGLSFLRSGSIDKQKANQVYQKLLPYFPAQSDILNKELSRLLSYLAVERGEGKTIITRVLQELENTKDQLQFIHYQEVLRHIPKGWTAKQRLAYQHWLNYSRDNFSGGSLFKHFITTFEKDFYENLIAE